MASFTDARLYDTEITCSGTAQKIYTTPAGMAAPPGAFGGFVTIQADPGNSTNNVLVGTATSQSFVLTAGSIREFPVDDVSTVYVKAAAGSPKANIHIRF